MDISKPLEAYYSFGGFLYFKNINYPPAKSGMKGANKSMERNQENYEKILNILTPKLAELLLSGYSVEISQSRGGVKMSRITRKYEIVPNYIFNNNTGRC